MGKGMMSSDPTLHSVGSNVWIADSNEGWIAGQVKHIDGPQRLTVLLEDGTEKVCSQDEIPLQNPGKSGVEDMTTLNYLNEPGVLWNLKTRYQQDDIYTYTGSILIAVNPFSPMPHLYGPHMMDQYRNVPLGELSPHVYAIADSSYRQMKREKKSQSILISGESGAGKTETSKLIMQYLAWMGGHLNDDGTASIRDDGSSQTVEQKVLESNPLLEAFGNAKTVRNDNSSRFGKFTEIQFDEHGRICGAAIRTYLLERSRVTSVNDPERNYHIFYQLCDGAAAGEERDKFKLTNKTAKDFRYLNQSTCYDLQGVSNAEEYCRTRRSMDVVGLSRNDQDAVFSAVAAVLHLGNIQFKAGEDDDAAQLTPESKDHLTAAADLLGVPAVGLKKALTTRTRQTPDGPIVSPLDAAAASANRDALAKTLYSRLFDWIVAAVNTAIGQSSTSDRLIGVLDIYGFEQFATNDFEQFCINLANEKLQQHFNGHVFKQEQAEYEREAIDWSYIEFVDNQDVLDLIEGKLGIIDLLDETCRFPKAKNDDLAQKLYNAPSVSQSKRFSKPKLAQTDFTIDHYAGDVTYKTEHFLDKNRDFVVAEHQELLGNSEKDFVSKGLFPNSTADGDSTGGASSNKPGVHSSYKFSSVGARFKRQLGDLMQALRAMEPHYVRCIKPNGANRPMIFESPGVLHQLRCGGVLEAVRISCAGYPSKVHYTDFADHFWPLAVDLLNAEDRALAERVVLEVLGADGKDGNAQFGRSKLFLRAGKMALLDKRRTEVLNQAASCIQKYIRGWLARRYLKRAIAAVVTIQAAARGRAARRLAQNLRENKAACVIQKSWRGYSAKQQFKQTVRAVVAVQAAFRGYTARKYFKNMRKHDAAAVIQATWKGSKQRRDFTSFRTSVIAIQCAWRIKMAKRELRRRRAESRESGKLMQDKQNLESKLKEVQNILENVQTQRNELRQALRDEKSQRESLESQVTAMEQEMMTKLAAAAAASAAALAAEHSAKTSAESQLGEVRQRLEAAVQEAESKHKVLTKQLQDSKQRIAILEQQKQELENMAKSQAEDLMGRLNNALAQRNEAREQALMAEARVKQLQEDIESGKLMPVVAAGGGGGGHLIAASPSQKGSGPQGEEGMMDRVRRYMTAVPGASPGAVAGAGQQEGMSEMDRRQRELYHKQQQLLKEQRAADQERLLNAIKENLGFYNGKPVAAVTVFRCILQWKTLQADRTPLFDRLSAVIGMAVESKQDDNTALAYWLSNTVTLFYLLQKNTKPANAGGISARLRAQGQQVTRGLFGSGKTAAGALGGLFGARSPAPGMKTGGGPGGSPTALSSAAAAGGGDLEASIHGGGAGGFRQVEAKYPALLFKQQMDAYVQRIFPMLRDNVKKVVAPQLTACIHAPRLHGSGGSGSGLGGGGGGGGGASSGRGNRGGGVKSSTAADAQQGLSPHWGEVLKEFDALMALLKDNHVPAFLIRKLFEQLFSFVNVQLFNQLLLRRECCSFSNGEYVKTGLAEVERWAAAAGKEWVGNAWEALAHIRQAVTFLVIHQKHKKTLDEIRGELCPVLSVQQLYRISTMYWDDRYGTETVSHEVLAAMKQKMVESASNAAASHSFLLDDDATIPFTHDDVSQLMDVTSSGGGGGGGDGNGGGEGGGGQEGVFPVPEALREVPSFAFLQKSL